MKRNRRESVTLRRKGYPESTPSSTGFERGRRGSRRRRSCERTWIHTWMLWPVLGGDDGLSPAASPTPVTTGAAPVKGVNKLTPLLLCAPCKPSGHRKSQSSTQWYVQQVKRQIQAHGGWWYMSVVLHSDLILFCLSLSLSLCLSSAKIYVRVRTP